MLATQTQQSQPRAERAGARMGPAGFSKDRLEAIVTRLRLVTAPSRHRIVMILDQGERSVGDIGEALNNPSQPAVSHQLSLLRHGRLIESHRRGRQVIYSLTGEGRTVAEAFRRLSRISFGRDGHNNCGTD